MKRLETVLVARQTRDSEVTVLAGGVTEIVLPYSMEYVSSSKITAHV